VCGESRFAYGFMDEGFLGASECLAVRAALERSGVKIVDLNQWVNGKTFSPLGKV